MYICLYIYLSHSLGDIMGKMIGIIAGVFLFVAAMVFLLWFRKKKKNRRIIKKVNIMNDVANSDESESKLFRYLGLSKTQFSSFINLFTYR